MTFGDGNDYQLSAAATPYFKVYDAGWPRDAELWTFRGGRALLQGIHRPIGRGMLNYKLSAAATPYFKVYAARLAAGC